MGATSYAQWKNRNKIPDFHKKISLLCEGVQKPIKLKIVCEIVVLPKEIVYP